MNSIATKNQLAVIIPAFKATFLAQTLKALVCQTDQRFNIYVCDDASPADIRGITESVLGDRPYTYKRFEQNLGGVSLAGHWNRSVAESHEPWVWLFSDDDVMEADCVGVFYRTLEATGGSFDVYRFDTLCVDENDRPIRLSPPHPEEEGWMDFAYFLLDGSRNGTAQEAIVSRKAFEQTGGWINFPLAWFSDHASLMAWSANNGLRGMEGARVRWRRSGLNISSTRENKFKMPKVHASMQFVEFLMQRVEEDPDPCFPLPADVFKPLTREWFMKHLMNMHHSFGPRECLFISHFLTKTWHDSMAINMVRLLKVNLNATYAFIRNFIRRARVDDFSTSEIEAKRKMPGTVS
jgi:hypothetical protein